MKAEESFCRTEGFRRAGFKLGILIVYACKQD